MEEAVKKLARQLFDEKVNDMLASLVAEMNLDIQVQIVSTADPMPIRQLDVSRRISPSARLTLHCGWLVPPHFQTGSHFRHCYQCLDADCSSHFCAYCLQDLLLQSVYFGHIELWWRRFASDVPRA